MQCSCGSSSFKLGQETIDGETIRFSRCIACGRVVLVKDSIRCNILSESYPDYVAVPKLPNLDGGLRRRCFILLEVECNAICLVTILSVIHEYHDKTVVCLPIFNRSFSARDQSAAMLEATNFLRHTYSLKKHVVGSALKIAQKETNSWDSYIVEGGWRVPNDTTTSSCDLLNIATPTVIKEQLSLFDF